MHELELGCGGLATFLVHDQWPSSDPKRMAAVATQARVHTYLSYHYARRDGLPEDPYDPNEWGHDARVKSIAITSNRQDVVFTPTFDPEVTEYTTDSPVAPPGTVTVSTVDAFAKASYEYLGATQGYTGVKVTCVANDGVTSKDYYIRVNTG